MVSIFRKDRFEDKFPMFVNIIEDEEIRKNMLNNEDLIEKCTRLNASINALVNELTQRFDNETIFSIISNTVFKYPTELLVEFISAYLNSDNLTKSNTDIVKYYNRTLQYGEDCIKYVSENGIITNSKRYKNLPTEVVESMYKTLVTEDIKIGNSSLYDNSKYFTIDEKKYIISLLENGCWDYLNKAFTQFGLGVTILVKTLYKCGVDKSIINETVYNNLTEGIFNALLFYLVLANNKNVTDCVKELIVMDDLNVLNYLIRTQNIEKLKYIDSSMIACMSLDEILEAMNNKEQVLQKEDK